MRTREFMDSIPDPSDIPKEILDIITAEETWDRLCHEWDRMYPNNPVSGDDQDEE